MKKALIGSEKKETAAARVLRPSMIIEN